MMLSAWVAVALIVPVSFFVGAVVQRILIMRQRHGGGTPLPPWLITAERASPGLRELVAKMARAAAKDTMAEWSTIPPALQLAIRAQVHGWAREAIDQYMGAWGDKVPPQIRPAMQREIGRMVAEAFAIHTGRRN